MVELAVMQGLDGEASQAPNETPAPQEDPVAEEDMTPKQKTELKYKRPWWVCQPHVRPLPEEAIKLGSLQLSKKEKAKLALEEAAETKKEPIQRSDDSPKEPSSHNTAGELPKAAL
ncbi:tRNA dihydrouridine synthase, partial [Exophiala xenobiotica]